jgi:hypothetical protein
MSHLFIQNAPVLMNSLEDISFDKLYTIKKGNFQVRNAQLHKVTEIIQIVKIQENNRNDENIRNDEIKKYSFGTIVTNQPDGSDHPISELSIINIKNHIELNFSLENVFIMRLDLGEQSIVFKIFFKQLIFKEGEKEIVIDIYPDKKNKFVVKDDYRIYLQGIPQATAQWAGKRSTHRRKSIHRTRRCRTRQRQ